MEVLKFFSQGHKKKKERGGEQGDSCCRNWARWVLAPWVL